MVEGRGRQRKRPENNTRKRRGKKEKVERKRRKVPGSSHQSQIRGAVTVKACLKAFVLVLKLYKGQ